MAVSKIKAQLPKGEANGLDAIADALAEDFTDNPKRTRVLVMIVDCGAVKLERAEDAFDVDGEPLPPGVTATARIRRVEAVAPGDEDVARRILVRGYEFRNGRAALPLAAELDLADLGQFTVHPRTGEVDGGRPDSGE
jgi:hypothetical protein